MALHTSRESIQDSPQSVATQVSTFPTTSHLQSPEQMRRFELLRLAFFSLKLRKLEQRPAAEAAEESEEQVSERAFQCNLLRHVIFQQVFTLIQLDARDQAMQIINTCQK